MKTGLVRFLDNFQPESYRSTPPPEPPAPWRTMDRLTGEEVAELIARYESGETSRELATEFGIGKTAVVRLLRDNGVQIRPRGVPPSA